MFGHNFVQKDFCIPKNGTQVKMDNFIKTIFIFRVETLKPAMIGFSRRCIELGEKNVTKNVMQPCTDSA